MRMKDRADRVASVESVPCKVLLALIVVPSIQRRRPTDTMSEHIGMKGAACLVEAQSVSSKSENHCADCAPNTKALAACPKSYPPSTLPLMGGPSRDHVRMAEEVRAFGLPHAPPFGRGVERTAPPRASSIYGTRAGSAGPQSRSAPQPCRLRIEQAPNAHARHHHPSGPSAYTFGQIMIRRTPVRIG